MEPEELYDGVSQLGVVLTDIVEFGFTFASSLLECLSDSDEQASNGACVYLNILLTKHQIQSQLECAQFVKLALSKLRFLSSADKLHARTKCRHGILTLFAIVTTQNPQWMIDELLRYRKLGKP